MFLVDCAGLAWAVAYVQGVSFAVASLLVERLTVMYFGGDMRSAMYCMSP